MLKKEPAVIVGAVSAVLAVAVSYGLLSTEKATAWGALAVAVLPLVQGLVTRQLVFAPATLEEAGLNPAEVEASANDPNVATWEATPSS